MKKTILTMVIGTIVMLAVTGCGAVEDAKKDVENAEKELQETYEKYGWVEKETVELIVAKFNTEMMDYGLNTPASDDYMAIENDTYWYGLTENISYYLKPIKFSGDKEVDILDVSGLQFDKEGYNEEIALTYVKHLIKANHNEMSDSEIEALIQEAKQKADAQTTANNGKGISVGFVEKNDYYEYQVVRLYK